MSRLGLKEFACEVKDALKSGASAPLALAGKVVALASEWDSYRDEAEGLSASGWLRLHLGPGHGLSWFVRRARAVERLGESSRREWDHEAAVWASENVKDETQLVALKEACRSARASQNGVYLTRVQVQRIARNVVGFAAVRDKKCSRCAQLEARIRELE